MIYLFKNPPLVVFWVWEQVCAWSGSVKIYFGSAQEGLSLAFALQKAWKEKKSQPFYFGSINC